MESEQSEQSEPKSGRRLLTGRVVSDKMDKTVTVEVVRTVMHRKYHKFVTRRKRVHAHDESNECKVDDEDVIQESRPLSRTKRWVVIERRKSSGIVTE